MNTVELIYRIVKKILKTGNFYRFQVFTWLILKGQGVSFKNNFATRGIPCVERSRHDGKIIIGNHLTMNNGLHSNLLGYSTPCVLRAENARLVIGDNVGMSQTALVAVDADITVGNNTLFGGGVKVYTTDFHSLDYIKRRDQSQEKYNRKSAPVIIGQDCFIGAGTIILKGVSIGDRSIIAAGSIVTKDIPSDVIAGGNPCRIIRTLNSFLFFYFTIQASLLEIWNSLLLSFSFASGGGYFLRTLLLCSFLRRLQRYSFIRWEKIIKERMFF